MMKAIHMRGFRSFADYTVKDLARVNLLVGANNCGKTSVLEAVELLARGPWAFERIMRDRGEHVLAPSEKASRWLEVRHLFHGNELTEGGEFAIEDEGGKLSTRVRFTGAKPDPDGIVESRDAGDGAMTNGGGGGGYLTVRSHVLKSTAWTPRLTADDYLDATAKPAIRTRELALIECQTIGLNGLDAFVLDRLWNAVVLTPLEEDIVASLQLVEPRIDRVGVLWPADYSPVPIPGAFIASIKGRADRFPLGNFGGGVKRMLGLSLALSQSANGFLLVDEIDTGLHYSVMEPMWRMVIETARRLDVQIFATTHSEDCIHGLGWLYEDDPALAEDVRIHRIERRLDHSIWYAGEELPGVARSHIEIR